MSPIRVLADDVIDQIAAGEVVERPSSVVKELVENALDAGASSIRVAVRDGGTTWIQVVDDGCGMAPDEARLALRRHATSKVGAAVDLETIGSFGFRGEALPAIASVSNFRMVTRPSANDEGFEIRLKSGQVLGEQAVGAPPGTRIEVADLFESVPARRKFLKRSSTEWSHVVDGVGRLALALPEVHFEIRRDEAKPHVWPATREPLERVAAVLSEEEASSFVSADREAGGVRLRGFVSSPERTRPNARAIRVFVNGRPVTDGVIRGALLQAYRDLLPRGRYPSAVLFLEVPPGAVDVNVHPAKSEVRFASPQDIHQLVRRTVRDAMESRNWLAEAPSAPGFSAASLSSEARSSRRDVAEPGEWIFREGTPAGPAPQTARAVSPERPSEPGTERPMFGALQVVGQILASYLVVEGQEGVLLIDQHAAHERVLYERLRGEWSERGVERQGLLAPEIVEVGAGEAAALRDGRQFLSQLGFDIDDFGEDTVAVRAVPSLLAGSNPGPLVRDLASEWREAGGGDLDVRALGAADRIFASLACHSARRAGDRLEVGEQRALLRELDTIPWAPTCPHGRPVAIQLDRGEIERRFGRR